MLRDIIVGDRRYFRELLTGSLEGIVSNILPDRLKRLVAACILGRDDAARGRRVRYSLTEAAIKDPADHLRVRLLGPRLAHRHAAAAGSA